MRDIACSLAESGFTDIAFISGRLTNDWAAKVGANQATHDLPEETYVYAFLYWDALSGEDMEEYLSFDAGWHANIGETAAVMAIDEGLVDLENTSFDDPDMPMESRTLQRYWTTSSSGKVRTTGSGRRESG